jgi:hypothetical protein
LYEHDEVIWTSLVEALSILYYNFPLKTEAFFDEINSYYMKHRMPSVDYKPLRLKGESANIVNKKFDQLCQAKLKGNTFIIKNFITNYKNTWLFAALPNNILLTNDKARKAFVNWGINSFYKNIDNYTNEPKEFVKQTLIEILNILEQDEPISNMPNKV